jgi:hypothetical protein
MAKTSERQYAVSLATAILVIFWLTACNLSSQSQGPMTWIDQPLDGAHLPLAPLMIQAHAADADGIARIEFLIFADPIASVSKGGARLEEASIEWTPPGAGTYTISVLAIDKQGNSNGRAPASVEITVGNNSPASGTPTPTPAVNLLATEPLSSATPTVTPTLGSAPQFTLQQNANCRLTPRDGSDVVDVLMKGVTVPIEGRDEHSDWFRVRKSAGSELCWVSASTGIASGNWQAMPVPATLSLLSIVTATQADIIPPSISNVTIAPTSVSKLGCGTINTFSISAIVTDGSTIGNVIYEIHGPGPLDAGDGYLLPVGGDVYQATVGPIAGSAGYWTISLRATDMAYNTAVAGPWTIQVVCIE